MPSFNPHTPNRTSTILRPNLGFLGERPAPKCLSHDTAIRIRLLEPRRRFPGITQAYTLSKDNFLARNVHLHIHICDRTYVAILTEIHRVSRLGKSVFVMIIRRTETTTKWVHEDIASNRGYEKVGSQRQHVEVRQWASGFTRITHPVEATNKRVYNDNT
jgi:hypothetical protein